MKCSICGKEGHNARSCPKAAKLALKNNRESKTTTAKTSSQATKAKTTTAKTSSQATKAKTTSTKTSSQATKAKTTSTKTSSQATKAKTTTAKVKEIEEIKIKKNERDQALWVKFDNITEKEATNLQAAIIKDKARIAPKARGTAAKGTTKELPERIRENLRLTGGSNGTKKK